MKNQRTILFISLLTCLLSCRQKNNELASTYTITGKDFVNSILVEGVVEPTQFSTLSCPMNVNGTIVFLVEEGTMVRAGEVVCIIEDNNIENEYDNLQLFIEAVNAELNKRKADLQMQYALLEAQVKNNEADTEIANLDSLQFRFASPTQRRISELELERAFIEKTRLRSRLHALEIINESEIRTLEIQIKRLGNRLETVKKNLDELTIRAPKDGLAIIAESRRTGSKLMEGENVWNNMPLVIIPELKEMKVRMRMNETDFKYISEQDSVSYSFNAMPGNKAYGKIIRKQPVGQPVNRDSKVKYFEAEASIDSLLEPPEPGFTAESRVIVRYLPDTIVVPLIAISEVDSMKVVHVKNRGKYEMRQIKTGLSSQKESVITEGLRRGEIISLITPHPSQIRSSKLPREQ